MTVRDCFLLVRHNLRMTLNTFQEYGHREVADGKTIFNRVQQKCMISLKDWVKDKVRLQGEAEIETGTTRAECIKAIEEPPERK